MPLVRKLIRDAVLGAMAQPALGFNAKLLEISEQYGIAPFALSFAANSKNVFQGFVTPETADISQFAEYPALALYTSSAASETGDPSRQKFRKFSGVVVAHLDFYLKFKEGKEWDDTDSICDAVEDACIEVLHDPLGGWPNEVAWNGDYRCDRDPLTLLGDGWEQRIPITLTFGVHS